MPWYAGPSLLELLEALPAAQETQTAIAQPTGENLPAENAAFRFPVQRVVRPDHTFRGFAGQIASGTVRPGDAIVVLPSARTAKVERIATYDGDLEEAIAPLSITLVLDRELDISRGDLIAAAESPATAARGVKASLVWMDQRPLDRNRRYLLKHTSHTVPAFISSIDHRVDLAKLTRDPALALGMNDIGAVSLRLLRPIAVDLYSGNRATGAFILIDAESNATVAAGMITAAWNSAARSEDDEAAAWGRVTAGEREARWGHRGAVVELAGPVELIDAIERSLFVVGAVTCRINAGERASLLHLGLLNVVTDMQAQSGLLVLVVSAEEGDVLTVQTENSEITLDAGDSMHAIAEVHRFLHGAGIFISTEKANL
jgi:hypothetical protein